MEHGADRSKEGPAKGRARISVDPFTETEASCLGHGERLTRYSFFDQV
jgi:hypothetical protein